MDTQHPDSEIIDALGGTAAVARLCQVKPPSVSDWRKEGIPPARRMFLEAVRPDVFKLATAAPAQQEAA
ncbi:YdaS family helix-turn-helix protein [Achromobacter xylosoxidans]|uniref:YdaS family helix-turn-helix protein n=1 Tax=Alcaligenes xylosoxydans xylosoxydans TaxID=85698 RepID=UPI00047D072D|nr:YdaS family helix-turn-helix protein [Achromobacter xylosoxidans]CUJ51703.1 Uncharacterized protein conserved in bacteria%2C prophage-related [Achromobacter xylosoxidans]